MSKIAAIPVAMIVKRLITSTTVSNYAWTLVNYNKQWRCQELQMGVGLAEVFAPSTGRFLQFFNKNNAFLCIFRPK